MQQLKQDCRLVLTPQSSKIPDWWPIRLPPSFPIKMFKEEPRTTNQDIGTKNKERSASDAEVLVKVENVSKKFCRDLKKSLWYGLKDVAGEMNPFTRPYSTTEERRTKNTPSLRSGEFWAVNDVSFELRRGECLGLIGRNGAGKTTLLKMLNGLIKPDSGSITMRGRVGALIALGAGFNPILTGRENIFVNGSILGLSKSEIDSKFDEIMDFAEISEFIDTPVQSYSSGMQVRLGFSIAASLRPDVLILDEVLAVGDFAFRMKCLERISRLLPETGVIFVSHNEDQVRRICSSALYLENGKSVQNGTPDSAFIAYHNNNLNGNSSEVYCSPRICSIDFLPPVSPTVPSRSSFQAKLEIVSTETIHNAIIRLIFTDVAGNMCAEWNSALHSMHYDLKPNAVTKINLSVPQCIVRPGVYYVTVLLADSHNREYLAQIIKASKINVTGRYHTLGYCQL